MIRMVLASGKTPALVEQEEEFRNRLIVFDKGARPATEKGGCFLYLVQTGWMPLWGRNEPWSFLTPYTK